MEDPLPKLLAIVLIGLALATCSKMEQDGSEMEPTVAEIATDDSAIIAQAPHFYNQYSVYGMVDCIEQEESGGNPNAINWNDWHKNLDGTWKQGSFGCLQFSEDTFNEYCITKYGLAEKMTHTILMNCSIQRECAVKMLEENKGHRWSTYKICI